MEITLFQSNKKPKSTLIPSGGVRVRGEIKHDCSIMDPVFRFSPEVDSDITRFNMLYAPGFKRYYYISLWSYRAGFWEAECSVDVLASFKSIIGSTRMYCMRSANQYDGRIQDNLYPTYHASSAVQTAASPWGQADRYIIGVIGPADTSQAGSVTYYCMPPGSLKDFMKSVLAQNRLADDGTFNWGNLATAIRAAILNPIEYIVSCTYIPFQPPLGNSTNKIYYGWWSADVSNTNFVSDTLIHNIPDFTVAIPHHPQMSSKGVFVQNAPYSRFELQVNPFGVIPLDGSLIQDAVNLRISIKIDLVTGQGIMEVYTVFQDNTERFLTRVTAQVGVPIQLSQESANLSGILQAGNNIAQGAVSGGAIGAGIAAVSSVGSVSEVITPTLQSTGTNGARAGLSGLVKLHATFYTIAAGDDTNQGRPLLETVTPSVVGGYMQMLNGLVPLTAGMTASERDEINQFMESGFYYE